MTGSPAGRAARNNAAWCDAVCRAHGGDTRFERIAWWNERRSPPFYPNLVTLDPSAASRELEAIVAGLSERAELGEFGIKDSFCQLDLAPAGFARLFDASWTWRAPRAPAARTTGWSWTRARAARELADWEAAWWRIGEPGFAEPRPVLFPPSLLALPDVSFLAARDGDRIVAGCAVTLTEGVAGIACRFHDAPDPSAAAAEVFAEVSARHPERALAGYDAGEALEIAGRCGFEAVGPLRVWRAGPAPRAG